MRVQGPRFGFIDVCFGSCTFSDWARGLVRRLAPGPCELFLSVLASSLVAMRFLFSGHLLRCGDPPIGRGLRRRAKYRRYTRSHSAARLNSTHEISGGLEQALNQPSASGRTFDDRPQSASRLSPERVWPFVHRGPSLGASCHCRTGLSSPSRLPVSSRVVRMLARSRKFRASSRAYFS